MDKNWLIRTKSNHILGPVSKEKVQELYKNGSIKPDDEVCCGNGYWFFIREDDMVERFLTGSEVQGFNPISEAKDVLTLGSGKDTLNEKDDITRVGGLNLSMLNGGQPAAVPPVPDPQLRDSSVSSPKESPVPEIKKKNKSGLKARPGGSRQVKPLRKQDYLKYVSILGFLFLFLLVYFRKSIIRSFFQGEMTLNHVSLISVAHAQDEVPLKKKKAIRNSRCH